MEQAPKLFDFRRHRLGQFDKADFIARDMIEGIKDRLAMINRGFARMLIIGDHLDILIADIQHEFGIEEIHKVALDERELIFSENADFDAVISFGVMHWLNDPTGHLIQAKRLLKPDGLFIGCMLAGQTLYELRTAFAEAETEILGGISPHVAPMAEIRDLGGLLQRAGFALPVADIDTLTVSYGSALSLMQDLRNMNETNIMQARSRKGMRKSVLSGMMDKYINNFSNEDGSLCATFDIATLTAWAPSPDQQQPLRPGSAKARLADALNTAEIKTS